MPPSAAPAHADMHREPATHPPWLGKLILILVLDPLLPDLPATLTPIRKRRVQLLIDLPRPLTVTMPAVIITQPPPPRRALPDGSPRENGAA